MRWAGYVACLWRRETHRGLWSDNLKKKKQDVLGELDLGGNILLKLI